MWGSPGTEIHFLCCYCPLKMLNDSILIYWYSLMADRKAKKIHLLVQYSISVWRIRSLSAKNGINSPLDFIRRYNGRILNCVAKLFETHSVKVTPYIRHAYFPLGLRYDNRYFGLWQRSDLFYDIHKHGDVNIFHTLLFEVVTCTAGQSWIRDVREDVVWCGVRARPIFRW